jgi:hypothetical protein
VDESILKIESKTWTRMCQPIIQEYKLLEYKLLELLRNRMSTAEKTDRIR